MKKLALHLKVEQENTLPVSLLTNACDLSINQIKQAIDKGAMWLTVGKHTRRSRRLKKALATGTTLHFYYDADVLGQKVDDAQLLLDKNAFSIWYKPYGMLSQGSKWSDHTTLTRYVEKQLNRTVFLVHRLDRAATGIMLVAHSKSAARAFSAMFEHHNLTKIYQIISHGSCHLTHHAIDVAIDGKAAYSEFTALDYDATTNCSLIEVKIKTGRKHQIRKHAAALGFPVFGDRLHGGNEFKYSDNEHLALCAVNLAFECPLTGESISVTLPDTLRPSLHTSITSS